MGWLLLDLNHACDDAREIRKCTPSAPFQARWSGHQGRDTLHTFDRTHAEPILCRPLLSWRIIQLSTWSARQYIEEPNNLPAQAASLCAVSSGYGRGAVSAIPIMSDGAIHQHPSSHHIQTADVYS